MRVSATLDTRELERSLKQLTKELNKTAEETITEMAASGCRQLAIATEPRGLSQKQKDISQKVVYKDFSKAYDYIGQTYNSLKERSQRTAIAFAKAVNNGDYNAAERYARKYLPGYQFRETADDDHIDTVRNQRGRVRNNAEQLGAKSITSLDSIKEARSRKIGYVKAAWLAAGKKLKSKGRIPEWLRHNKSNHLVSTLKTGWSFTIIVTNLVTYTTNILSESKKKKAIMTAYTGQLKRMQKKVEAACRKF